MKILVMIALLSFAALAGAAFAITRHIRKGTIAAIPEMPKSEETEALAARLSTLVRPAADDRVAGGLNQDQRDFAYFNREPAEKPERTYSDIPYSDSADRPGKSTPDHL